MPVYQITLEGLPAENRTIEAEDVAAARNEAVRFLGGYLSQHPGFAGEGHWRVIVRNDLGQPLLHVIVATVTARSAPPDPATD